MLSPETIREMQLKAARKAKRNGLEPALCEDWDVQSDEARTAFLRTLPFLGDYVPAAWEALEGRRYFVDSSGFGQPGEPALTFEEMAAKLEQGLGYALTEAGEFQVFIQAYRKRKVVYL